MSLSTKPIDFVDPVFFLVRLRTKILSVLRTDFFRLLVSEIRNVFVNSVPHCK